MGGIPMSGGGGGGIVGGIPMSGGGGGGIVGGIPMSGGGGGGIVGGIPMSGGGEGGGGGGGVIHMAHITISGPAQWQGQSPDCGISIPTCMETNHLSIKMTSKWVRWRLKSPASRLFIQPFIQAWLTENIKAPRHWPLWGEFTGDQWILRAKGQ